ncbi:MAG: RimK/LysX family protein [Pseudomonadota bacterium]|nr:RimK/LysX family protein [Pseudomonadota bacterium]
MPTLPRPSMSLALLLCALFVPQSGLTMPVVGWVERVKIYPGEIILEAKLDTGTKTASIDARDIETFERKGTPWVRFRIVNRDAHGLALERPLVRETKIQRHFGKRQRRPVVKLGVCVGDLYREVQVNLVNRSGFIYPMLIGRMFMKKQLLVDPARRYTVAPKCAQAPKDG